MEQNKGKIILNINETKCIILEKYCSTKKVQIFCYGVAGPWNYCVRKY